MTLPSQMNINQNVVAFSDTGLTNNPTMRLFDWGRNINGLTVYQPKAEQHLVPARGSLTLLNGLRTMTFDGTTRITVSNLVDDTYRFAFTAGTDPTFATNIPLSFVGQTLTVTVGTNQTVTLTAGSASFAGVTEGSYVYIYSPTDNPSAAFSVLNSGVWVVMANGSDTTLTLARPTGTSFSATPESITASATGNMIAYTLGNVQVGDKMRIITPFALASRATYTVESVTSKWVDVVSTVALVGEVVAPSTTGMVFYVGGKRYIRVEANQRSQIFFNGDTNNNQELEPWQAGDLKFMAWQERVGPVWAASITNLATVPMVVNVFSAE